MRVGDLTSEIILRVFDFDKETGIFSRKKASSGHKANHPITALNKIGYIQFKVEKATCLAHRAVWIVMNGSIPDGMQIDHINGVRHDNRPVNLRLATNLQNSFNAKLSKASTTGYKGVKVRGKRFVATIKANGRARHLGVFDSAQEAHIMYIQEARKLVGEFVPEEHRISNVKSPA